MHFVIFATKTVHVCTGSCVRLCRCKTCIQISVQTMHCLITSSATSAGGSNKSGSNNSLHTCNVHVVSQVMMEPGHRGRKRALLPTLVRHSYVSMHGMESLLAELRKLDEIPQHTSVSTQRRARQEAAQQDTSYGKLVSTFKLPNDDEDEIAVQNPFAILELQARETTFGTLLREKLRQHPCSADHPWHVIFYHDEISPQDSLRGKDHRKIQAVYWSLAELGTENLCKEEAWMVACIARTDLVDDLDGGMSHFMKMVMNFFWSQDGFNFSESGMVLHFSQHAGVLHEDASESCMMFSIIGSTVADEKAHKCMLDCKGSSGLMFCGLCQNVTTVDSELADYAPAYAVSYHCIDVSKWRLHTDDSIRNVLLRLQVAKLTMGIGKFEVLQQMYGYNYNPNNIILDPHLNYPAASACMYDWMHVYVVTGVFNFEVEALMSSLRCDKGAFVTYEGLAEFCGKWVWPRHIGQTQVNCISENHHHDTGHFKCSASAALSLFSVFAYYFEHAVLPADVCRGEVLSFLALCTVMELLLQLVTGYVTPEELHKSIHRHLQLHLEAYDGQWWHPKHHMALHLPMMLARFGYLVSCFVHERKHRLIKRYLRDRLNTTSYELGALQDITLQSLHDLQDDSWLVKTGLLKKREPSKKMAGILKSMFPLCRSLHVSTHAVANHSKMTAGDIVAFVGADDSGVRFAELICPFEVDGSLQCVVSICEEVPGGKSGSVMCKAGGKRCVIDLESIACPLIHMWHECGEYFTALLPSWCRG